MNEIENRTDFLFPKRNFWSGLSSILDIGANKKKINTSKSVELADMKALQSDWAMIGKDFRNSMKSISF